MKQLLKTIYPDTESVSVVGGEELDPPNLVQFKYQSNQKMGFLVSEFNKSRILISTQTIFNFWN